MTEAMLSMLHALGYQLSDILDKAIVVICMQSLKEKGRTDTA
jgi:hypothetical protein